MPDADWYSAVSGDGIEQGDVLFGCPVYHVAPIPVPTPADHVPDVDVETHSLIVMTQSCDLVNDKVDQVLLAKVSSWADVVAASGATNTFVRSKDYRRKLVEGIVPGYALLNRHPGPPALPWSVVDFHRLYVLPKGYVRSMAAGRDPRLRLRSPYLEHLSQAFARYFMRVGLPHPLHDFIKDGGEG